MYHDVVLFYKFNIVSLAISLKFNNSVRGNPLSVIALKHLSKYCQQVPTADGGCI